MSNLTPEQEMIPEDIRRIAYQRLPMTCGLVSKILYEVQTEIMKEFDIDPADEAELDFHIRRAFLRIRDEVTQPMRTEQMKLIQKLEKNNATSC